jgi:hypothetical protein
MTIECVHVANGLNGAVTSTWLALPADEVGQVITIPNHSDKTLDVWGTLGGATAIVQGTNDPRALSDPDEAAWKTLDDHNGNSCSWSTSFPTYMPVLYPNAYYVRVKTTGGDGTTSVNFSLTSKRG